MGLVCIIGSDIELTDEVIEKLRSLKDYKSAVIDGQRPYTKDATYLQEEIIKENFRIPHRIRSEEEILESIAKRKREFNPNILLMASMIMSSEIEEMYKLSREIDRYSNTSNYQKQKSNNHSNFNTRKPYDTRTKNHHHIR